MHRNKWRDLPNFFTPLYRLENTDKCLVTCHFFVKLYRLLCFCTSSSRVYRHIGHQARSSSNSGANGSAAAHIQQCIHCRGEQLCHHNRTQHERQIDLPETSGTMPDHGTDRLASNPLMFAINVSLDVYVKSLSLFFYRLFCPRWVCFLPSGWSDIHQNWCGRWFWDQLFQLHVGNEGGLTLFYCEMSHLFLK